METVKTERLFFRPLELGDEKYIFPEVDETLTEHWIGWEPFKSIEEARNEVSKCVERAKHSPNVEFIVFNHAGDFVGCCDVSPCVLSPSTGNPEYEINLWVKRPEWGKGYGREMCNTMIEWAKQNTDLPYVVYSVTSGNVASERIVARMHLPILRQFEATKRGVSRQVTDYKLPLR